MQGRVGWGGVEITGRQGRAGQGRAGQGRAGQGRAKMTEQGRAKMTEQGRASQGHLLLGCSQLRLGRCLSLSRLLALSWVSFKQLHVRQLFSCFFSHHLQHLGTSIYNSTMIVQ